MSHPPGSGGEIHRAEEEIMAESLQVWRARVGEGSVARLLEARRRCPELLSADLVRLEDGAERLMRQAERFDAVARMHALLEDAVPVGLGVAE
jgi:hypothetical protein